MESCEPVDIPSVRLFLGGLNGSRGGGGWGSGGAGALGAAVVLNAGWFNGERGGDRIGLSDMGEGGTKGNDSRIESAVVDIADDPETLLFFSPPCACARACA